MDNSPSTPRPTTADDLALIKTAFDPQISPDGARVAYVVKTINREKNRYESRIWTVAVASPHEARQWTFGTGDNGKSGGESSPRWSPDGARLAFTSAREGKKGQIYLLPADGNGGEAERVTDLPAGSLGPIIWSPDGSRIAFTFRPQDAVFGEEAADERKKNDASTPAREITRLHFREEGSGFLPSARMRLHVLDVVTRQITPVTGEDFDVNGFCWSPDGSRLAYVRNTADDPDLTPNAQEIFVIPAAVTENDAVAAEPIKLSAPLGPKQNLAWSPDGRYIAYLGHAHATEVWGVTNAHLWVASTGDGGEQAARDLTPDWDVTFGNTTLGDVTGSGESGPVWASDGASLFALVSQNATVDVYRVSLGSDEPPRRVTEGVHVVEGFTVDAKTDTLALLVAMPTDAGDVYVLPTGSSFFKRLTRLNEELFAGLDLPTPRYFEAQGAEGHAVPCFALLPPDYDRNPGPRPTVLYLHGGPHLMYGHALFHDYQVLAAQGYVVLFPNPRGSKGYGEAWTGGIKGNWGEPAQADSLACLDHAIKEGWTDADRASVIGGSYGGYLTAWMLAHSDRFRAGVAERGVYNLVSMAGTCDFVWRDDRSYFDANATDDTEDYRRNSPLTYASQINAPLLLIHSEGDLRCPIEQADQLFAALKRLNRDVTYLRYGPESNHGLTRNGPPDLRIDRQNRILGFFDKHLKETK